MRTYCCHRENEKDVPSLGRFLDLLVFLRLNAREANPKNKTK